MKLKKIILLCGTIPLIGSIVAFRSQLESGLEKIPKIFHKIVQQDKSPTLRDSIPSPSPTHKSTEELQLERIRKIAEKSAVFISRGGLGLGSGVIIAQNGDRLYILTTSHVIGIPPRLVDMGDGTSQPEDPYKITTNDGKEFQVSHNDYERIVHQFSETDLAVLVLDYTSSKGHKDRVAKLETAVSPGIDVYIFGYLPCSPSKKGEIRKREQLMLGKIAKVESNPKEDSETHMTGYDVAYNNNTIKGMSGSPIFNAAGRVVAIHAKTEKFKERYDSKACNSLQQKPHPDYGPNWGISINTLAISKKYWPPGLESILQIHPTPVGSSGNNSEHSDSQEEKSEGFFTEVHSGKEEKSCPPFIPVGKNCD